MDSLDDFEKALAAESAERDRAAQEKEARRERKHRHHHRDRSSERHHTDDRHRHRDRDGHRERDTGKGGNGGNGRRGHDHRRDRESDEEDRHRHKRSRHSPDDGEEDESRHRHKHRHRSHERSRDRSDRHERHRTKDIKDLKQTDPKKDLPLPDEEQTPEGATPLARDSWMTAPSALDIDYIHRGGRKETTPPVKEEAPRVLHKRELNRGLGEVQSRPEDPKEVEVREVSYKFGDEGSQWRMTKLKAVYTLVEQSGRSLDEVAEERFGTLREFDEAREEKIEMDRRKVYGAGYVGKEKPTGDMFAERMTNKQSEPTRSPSLPLEQGVVIDDMMQPAPPMDQSALNRMRAQLMKAKLRNAPDAAKLEKEYNAAMAAFTTGAASNAAVVLDASHNRMLAGARGEVKAVSTKRGVERGQVEANEDMSIEDMVREERRTRGQAGGEGARLAERIAKDARFDNDLDYLDENAEKLAKRVHKTDASLKNIAVTEYKKLNRILDTCPLCFHEDSPPPKNLPLAPVLSLATRTYLTLSTAPELTNATGGAVIVPLSHRTNLLECDDDEWEEIRNFMKSLTRLYHEQGRDVLFYENAAAPHRRAHAALVAVPIPYELGATAPAFFREAMLAADEEWAQHRKVIDTAKKAREGLGRMAFRRSLAKEMPYFHVWFDLDGGLGHVVEDASRWPKGDLFAREVVGGMVDCEPDVIKRQGRWTRNDDRVEGFKKRWRKFDWTRVLAEEG
ncbi:CwfJ C-terminus 1-domain-containing protein-like protein [Staphylotrichum tortipilum]|uniref:CwfJ C-terminus 1-domain-containing protein-like protein n=1 Tax=Staphylotrichum tortipilum TaxID=2831512 RepID=A0AAN6RRX2_9PEZI|nr:CwfJ C-terminus 1-domain-containing protein-like protein [Staphylotrichum longicolle]